MDDKLILHSMYWSERHTHDEKALKIKSICFSSTKKGIEIVSWI